MADDAELTELTEITSPAVGDLLYLVTDPAGSPLDRKITRENLLAIGSDVQAYDAGLADIAGLAVTDGNFIVGDGANWVAESGATARTSIGLGTAATPTFAGLTISGINGIDIGAAGADSDLITADGGAAVLKWDDSDNGFEFSKSLEVLGTSLKLSNSAGGTYSQFVTSADRASIKLLTKTVANQDDYGLLSFRGDNTDMVFSVYDASLAAWHQFFSFDYLNDYLNFTGAAGGVGVNAAVPLAKLHVDQSSATGAKPVLLLDQAHDAYPTLNSVVAEATTNAIINTALWRHNTSGTAAAGFGVSHKFQLESSTTADQDAAEIAVAWGTATHASRKAYVVFNVYDTAARECLRLQASGAAGMVGLFGVTPVVRQAHIIDADGTLADITTKFNTLLSYLEAYGLLNAA